MKKMIGTKLLSYKLDDGSMIEFTNAMSGFGRVYVNGEEVSKKKRVGRKRISPISVIMVQNINSIFGPYFHFMRLAFRLN